MSRIGATVKIDESPRAAPVLPFSDFIASIAERGRALIDIGRYHRETDPLARLLGICDLLLSAKGEAMGIAAASEALSIYDGLDPAGKEAFFVRLCEDYTADESAIQSAASAYAAQASAENRQALGAAMRPRFGELMRRLNQFPEATHALVRMRSDLIVAMRTRPELKNLDEELVDLFSTWFNKGFLELRRIDWNTPADILEKIIKYEAVHRIEGWDDLRRRIDPQDRCVYGFFHPRLANEPLIFVEVALVSRVPDAIGPLLAKDRVEHRAEQATTAVFYSISNCQSGLRRIPLGSFLIKQVVSDLQRRYPRINTFVTLSPVPSFGVHLKRKWEAGTMTLPSGIADWTELETAIRQKSPSHIAEVEQFLKQELAKYLLMERDAKGRVIDPVARFHLGNGARLERLNFGADQSERGQSANLGMMVNYLYAFPDIEKNHENYVNAGRVSASQQIRRLANVSQIAKSQHS